MVKVKLKVNILYQQKSISAGTTLEVTGEVAKRWERRKIASIVRDAPSTPEPESETGAGGDDLSSLSEKTASPQSKKRTSTSKVK